MFPFRYKLTLLITLIVIALMMASFWSSRHVIEQDIEQQINSHFQRTEELVKALMKESKRRLSIIGRALSGDELVRIILTDKSLDRVTADDMVQEEILPSYRDLELVAIVDANGKVRASDREGRAYLEKVLALPFIQRSMSTGRRASGYLLHDNKYLQLIAQPRRLGPEVIGLVVVGDLFSNDDVVRLKKLSGKDIDVAFLNESNHAFLTTSLKDDVPFNSAALVLREMGDKGVDTMVRLHGERYKVRRFMAQRMAPAYMVMGAFDKPLTSKLAKLIMKLLPAVLIGGCIAICIGLIFASGLAKPIGILQAATKAVDRADYGYRVSITSRDEFKHLGESFNQMIWGLGEKERIRSVMNKVVSKEIADELLKGNLELGGEEMKGTVFFSDIRGFSALSEGLSPKALIDLLNQYLTESSACIINRRGNIDKYQGDAIMALFGVPVSHGEDSYDAVQAALDLIEALDKFNVGLLEERGREIDVGVGIHTGTLLAGLMGTQDRLEYTVIGDNVNLASRLEGLTKQYGVRIIISEVTKCEIETRLQDDGTVLRELDLVQVKGKSEGVRIYQVFSRKCKGEDLAPLLERFYVARRYLEQAALDEALAAFVDLAKDWPHDKAVPIYIRRIESFLADPDLYAKSYRGDVYICDSK